MLDDSKPILTDYYDWLRSNSFEHKVQNNISRLSLPFLNVNNDYLEIYVVEQADGLFKLTDDGLVCSDLLSFGVAFDKTQEMILQNLLASYGMSMSDNKEIYTITDKDNLLFRKHLFVQCLMKVSDMFMLKRPSKKQSVFSEEITLFLDEHDVRYTPAVQFTGQSKLVNTFDFSIPKSKQAPERIVTAVNNLDLGKIRGIIFSWEDTKQNRANSRLFTIINNVEKNVSDTHLRALREYQIEPILWSDKETYLPELTA